MKKINKLFVSVVNLAGSQRIGRLDEDAGYRNGK